MNTFDLGTLDLDKRWRGKTVLMRQGDKSGTVITASLRDHGTALNTSGLTARWQMRLPNGVDYYRRGATYDAGTVSVTIDETTAASVAGETVGYFQVLQGSSVIASTEPVKVVILPDALADAEPSESYDSAIQDAIEALEQATNTIPEKVIAEVDAQLAAHPEWTTTVQDGSITEAKLATDLARDRERLLYRLDNMLTASLPEGDVATATDAAKTPMAALALYGRSTQDGTPTPSAPVAIQSVGGNLFNLTRKVDGTNVYYGNMSNLAVEDELLTFTATTANPYYGSQQAANSQYTSATGWLVPVEAGEKYTIRASDTSFNQFVVTAYDASKKSLGYTTNTGSGGTYVYTAPANAAYIVVRFGTTTATVGQTYTVRLAVYHGTTAYPYVPYGHAGLWARRTSDARTYTVTPIPLDGHELRSLPDGTRDELTVDERGHAVLVQRVGHKTFDGSSDEGWRYEMGGNYGSNFYVAVSDAARGSYGTRILLTCCPASPANYAIQDTGYISNSGNLNLTIGTTLGISTVDGFKSWLASNPTTAVYPLATPQTIDLGYVDAVPLCGPDLTAQAVPTAPFALEYERDLNVTLARLESAIATLA